MYVRRMLIVRGCVGLYQHTCPGGLVISLVLLMWSFALFRLASLLVCHGLHPEDGAKRAIEDVGRM